MKGYSSRLHGELASLIESRSQIVASWSVCAPLCPTLSRVAVTVYADLRPAWTGADRKSGGGTRPAVT